MLTGVFMFLDIKKIRKLRKKVSMTQSDLAIQSGVSQSMIAKIESGLMEPTYSNAIRIFNVLNEKSDDDSLCAKDFLKNKMVGVKSGFELKEVVKLMKKHGISQMPVIDNDHLVGLISERIILEHVFDSEKKKLVKDIMEDAPPIISKETPYRIIWEMLKVFQILVVGYKGNLIGVITKSDLIEKSI
jgi:predicted transcriptional regulator